MKIKKYLKVLQELAEKYPNADVVFASDAEGNSYDRVNYNPTPGHFNESEFVPEAHFEEYMQDFEGKLKTNAICLN